jgi:hypothetical protein
MVRSSRTPGHGASVVVPAWLVATSVLAFAILGGVSVWALATRTPARGGAEPAYYVAPDGDDADDGSEASPWRTLQAAADRAVPGSTVFVRAGTYRERVDVRVSGSAEEGPIVFRNYPGERPILDGEGLEVPADFSGMISIESQHHVTVQGLEIRGYRTAQSGHVPVGIWVSGASNDIRVLDTRIHDLGTDFEGRSGGDAHGIAVYGTDSTHAIRDVVIDGNELFDLTLGSSEALVVNGNVQGFEITDNEVHDTDNIGIDVIGFEGKAEDPSVDQARDGLVARNLVYDIDSYGNPAYGRDRSADGIYVDGGRDVVVERNVIHHVNIGIELASEHGGRSTSHITVRNNVVHDASVISLAIGGYDRRRGSTEDSVIVHNTFVGSEGVELLVQFDTRDNVIQNNIVVAGPGGGFLENPYRENEGNVIDHNVYYSSTASDAGTWQWKGRTYPTFESYREATGNDGGSMFEDPLFIDAGANDFRLERGSPAIDAGAYLPQSGVDDLGGEARLADGLPDIGAHELPAAPPSPTPAMQEPVTSVADLPWRSESNGWGPVERDLSNGEKAAGDGQTITIGGRVFASGVGTHAPSVVTLDLGEACTAFAADVGLDDETGEQGSVRFQVWGDGVRLADSGVVRGSQPSRPIYADVTGVEVLELRVSGGGDGIDFDHADWGDARVSCDA